MPGDEISEKKHKNIKHLMAMERNEDLSRRETRKFAGLGTPVFKIDFSRLNPAAYSALYERPETGASTPKATIPENELNTEVSLKNTAHHKAAVRARDEHYLQFRDRFLASTKAIMQKYDQERADEHRFNIYWAGNLKEITIKHI